MAAYVVSSGALLRPMRGRGVLIAALSATALLAGCASDMAGPDFAQVAPASQGNAAEAASPGSLAGLKAGFEAAPGNADKAVAYAVALKQEGQKQEAYSVLKTAMAASGGSDKALLSEFGRTALEFGDVSSAKEALAKADDAQNPDWRVVMARGTVLAQEGHYQMALPFFERAFALDPTHPSVVSNLALAYTMTGQAEKGEPLLRQAIASGNTDPRLKSNLALILKVQGKSEDQPVAATVAAPVAESGAKGSSPITTSSIVRTVESSPLPPLKDGDAAKAAGADNDYATDTVETE